MYIYICFFHDYCILNLSMIHDYINYKIVISLYLESEAMPVLGKCVQGAANFVDPKSEVCDNEIWSNYSDFTWVLGPQKVAEEGKSPYCREI